MTIYGQNGRENRFTFLSSSLGEFTENSHLSLFSSEWPDVVIKEEREDGKKHETTTCLPNKPSPILYQNYIYRLSRNPPNSPIRSIDSFSVIKYDC